MSEEKKLEQSEITSKESENKEEKKLDQEQVTTSPKTKLTPSSEHAPTEKVPQNGSVTKTPSQEGTDPKEGEKKDLPKESGYGMFLKRAEDKDPRKDGLLAIGPLPGMSRSPKQWEMIAMLREIISILENGDTGRAVLITMMQGQKAAQDAEITAKIKNRIVSAGK